ncbi:MAG: glycosyl transferase family 1 [Candidatus Hydrogenedentes bacterium]|nr:glycosyl transferase family 1 [Candidatus Hydrogenedentota bacterium]
MAKVLFFNIPSEGHTNPTLAYVAELVRRGEEVVYYSVPAFQRRIEATGARFRSYGEALPRDPFEVPPNLLMLGQWIMEDTQRIVQSLQEETRRERPDYVIHDALSVWGRILAYLLRRPAIASITTFAFATRHLLRTPGFGLDLLRMLPAGWPSLVNSRRLRRDLEQANDLPHDLLGRTFCNYAGLNIVFTSRLFQPCAEAFDERFKFVGPSIASRNGAPPFPYDWLDGRPLVYASLGTILTDHPEFYRTCMRVVSRMSVQAVLSTGRKLDRALLGPIPDNCHVAEYLPQLDLLKRASAFVTHGGMNSVCEGLYYNVPLVVVPQTAEQAFVGRRVAALGAGRLLKSKHFSAYRLERALQRILFEHSYRRRAEEVGADLRAAGGCQQAAAETIKFARAQVGVAQ